MNSDEITKGRRPEALRASKTKRVEIKDGVEVSQRGLSLLDKGTPRPWRIALTISSASTEIIIDLAGDTIVGRSFAESEDFPGIDLSPFNAYDAGVSREHAILMLEEDRLVISDNESANGTLLNDELLNPNQAYPIRHGDRLRLGTLELIIELLINPYELF